MLALSFLLPLPWPVLPTGRQHKANNMPSCQQWVSLWVFSLELVGGRKRPHACVPYVKPLRGLVYDAASHAFLFFPNWIISPRLHWPGPGRPRNRHTSLFACQLPSLATMYPAPYPAPYLYPPPVAYAQQPQFIALPQPVYVQQPMYAGGLLVGWMCVCMWWAVGGMDGWMDVCRWWAVCRWWDQWMYARWMNVCRWWAVGWGG